MAKSKIWIRYDDSPARLPMYVADSSYEMAKKFNVSDTTVRAIAHRVKTGELSHGTYACVDVDNK